MKYKILYPLLLLAGCFMMPACTDSEDEISGNDTPPAGALPSEEFVLNTLPDEPYAEDAICIVADDYDATFNSLELIGDGSYLLTFNPNSTPFYASEAGQAKGKGALSKNRTAIRTRGTRDENGTITSKEDGLQYGRFTKIADKKYRLSDGTEIDLQNASGSNGTVTYKGAAGHISTVYVNVYKPTVTDATKSICHTWECNDFEYWLYLNGLYIAHCKQVYSNGRVDSYYKAVSGGLTKDEFLDSFADYDDECCYKVVFTSTDENGGTYLCFYLDNEVDVCRWEWIDEKQGTLYWDDPYHPEDGVDEEHHTVRFAGTQMRIYGDGSTYDEDGNKVRLVGVNTLTRLSSD